MRNSLSTSLPGMTTQLVPRREHATFTLCSDGKSRRTEELQVTQVDDQSVTGAQAALDVVGEVEGVAGVKLALGCHHQRRGADRAAGELDPLPWAVGFRLRGWFVND